METLQVLRPSCQWSGRWLDSALLAACLSASLTPALADGLPIVLNGKSEYVIVEPSRPSAAERLAGQELHDYLQRISGADLKIRSGRYSGSRALVVSEWSHLQELVGRAASDGAQAEIAGDDYEIVSDKSRVLLVGGRGRSTLYSVYAFLEKLGCRWFAPAFTFYHGAAEIIPHSSTLHYPSTSAVHRMPASAVRKINVDEGISYNAQNLVELAAWMAKVGYNDLVVPSDFDGRGEVTWDKWRATLTPELQRRDIMVEVGGHSYPTFLNAQMDGGKLFAEHPEWFGQDRFKRRRQERRYVFCTSNPDAVRFFIARLLEYSQAHPEIQILDLWPPDATRWCQCSRCRALGSPAERQAILANQVKSQFARSRPDVRLNVLAYFTWIDPPQSAQLDKDISVLFCPIDRSFEFSIADPNSSDNAAYRTVLRAWRKRFDGEIVIHGFYRRYAWDSLPVILPHLIQEDLRYYLQVPVQGVSTFAEPGDWVTYELNLYALAKLAWDPSTDVDALTIDFCRGRYGAAAPVALRAFQVLEDVVRKTCSVPFTTRKSPHDLDKAQARLREVGEDLRRALPSCQDATTRRNLLRLSTMVQYALADLDLQKAVERHDSDEAIGKRIAALETLFDRDTGEGLFLSNGLWLSPSWLFAHYLASGPAPCIARCLNLPPFAAPACILPCVLPQELLGSP